MNKKGQATSEILILLPLMVLMAGSVISVGYICWQGVKVQQAANLAARIQGQERVGGGGSVPGIRQDNGLDGAKDKVPSNAVLDGLNGSAAGLSGFQGRPPGGVYGKYYSIVRDMFGRGEQNKLFVPPPVQKGVNSDTIEIVRVLIPPKIFDLKLPAIKLTATAYGGEDPHMYGLPRWGRPPNDPNVFYTGKIKNPRQD